VKNVSFAVLPVGVVLSVHRGLLARPLVQGFGRSFDFCLLPLFASKHLFIFGLAVKTVKVDVFAFFLKIEHLLDWGYFLALELYFIVGAHLLRVRVSNKPVAASSPLPRHCISCNCNITIKLTKTLLAFSCRVCL
jgi:hypothetical protein